MYAEEVGQGWPLLIKVTNDFPLIASFLKSHPQAAYSSTRLNNSLFEKNNWGCDF